MTSPVPTSIRVPNPRRLALPTKAELEPGMGQAQYLGVTHRTDREATRPWVARCLHRTLGNYKTAVDAAVARWICLRYDRDVVEDGGRWYGLAYQGKDESNLIITRFSGASEADVVRLIDQHMYEVEAADLNEENGEVNTVDGDDHDRATHVNTPANPILLPINPRRDAALPNQLPRTNSRGQYRGVTESKGQYIARWHNTIHLGTYPTAFEAGLTVHIAEHYDRDIVSDGRGGFRGRAFRKSLTGKPTIENFHATTEAQVMLLIDECHGITGRVVEASPTVVSIDQAIREFWDDIWLTHSRRDGQAVCAELYRMWHIFLAQHSFAHLVCVKEEVWCSTVDRVIGVQRFSLPYYPHAQALSVPEHCRLCAQPSQLKQRLWTQQWKMVMTATCSPHLCVATWHRRRMDSQRRDVQFRQLVTVEEISDRKLLQQRYPTWIDEWVPPQILKDDELDEAVMAELAQVDYKTLSWWLHLNPNNWTFRYEVEMRIKRGEG